MPKPTAKGFTTSRLARSFSSEQMPPLYVAMNPPTLRADCMPDRMMNLMPPFISPCEKAGPVAMSPPMAAPKMPPSRAAPIVLARHETGLRGLPPSSAAAAGAEVGEGVAGAMPAAGAVGEGTCAVVARTRADGGRGTRADGARDVRRVYIGGVLEEDDAGVF